MFMILLMLIVTVGVVLIMTMVGQKSDALIRSMRRGRIVKK